MAKKPIVKYPKNPLAKWPPTGGIPRTVTPFDSWWKVAEFCGRDVWDVIYFNFQTTDGAEVNYYMAKLLGCTQLSKNKRDYSFGRKDGLPITIYLPPPGWKLDPAAGAPPKPVRPVMDLADRLLAQLALAVLGNPAVARINFHIGPYHVTPHDFRKVADRIRSGTFAVYQIPSESEAAQYDPEANALYLRFGWHLTEQAKIIHEAVHAVFDLKKACNIFTIDDEAAAYLAESIYAQMLVRPSDRRQLIGSDGETEAIFLAAYETAMMVLNGVEIVDADFDALRAAIAAHSQYKAGARDVAGYDGVYETAPVL